EGHLVQVAEDEIIERDIIGAAYTVVDDLYLPRCRLGQRRRDARLDREDLDLTTALLAATHVHERLDELQDAPPFVPFGHDDAPALAREVVRVCARREVGFGPRAYRRRALEGSQGFV